MKRFRKLIIPVFGLGLLLVGLFLLNSKNQVEEVYVEPDQTQVYENIVSEEIVQNVVGGTGRPTYVEILDANIAVPVNNGYYNRQTQKWTLSKSAAQYAVMTPRPNQQSGNTFIYGHNRENVFSRLLGVKQGSVAFVTTDNNQKFIYKLKYSYTTDPTDSGFLYYDGPPRLTLQTCSGPNFENRTLFVYELVGVTNA